jgi:hypothetical protein
MSRILPIGICTALVVAYAVHNGGAPLAAQTSAQTARTFHACYVPLTGTIYRIKEADVRQSCSSASHVEFSWTDGVSTHNQLSGLTADDHPQYLLTQGVRNSVNGFAVTGTFGAGSIPATGAAVRLMWYPRKAAFRAGQAVGSSWDDGNVGLNSVAMGWGTTASGSSSTALGARTIASGFYSISMGWFTTASGLNSTALGSQTTASGVVSTALGDHTTASGFYSTAMGQKTTASGSYSTAIGNFVSTDEKEGSFIYGDRSSSITSNNSRENQFAVRAQHIWLGRTSTVTNPAGHFLTTSTGAHLTNGGTWTNNSDVNRKHLFVGVDAEQVLRKVATVPIATWSYLADDAQARHMGPTAQDFHAAFGLGHSETAISTVDADGVALAAIQALERRTRELQEGNGALKRENTELRTRLDRLERAVALLSADGALAVLGDTVRRADEALHARMEVHTPVPTPTSHRPLAVESRSSIPTRY